MDKTEEKRQQLVEKMADHLLKYGFAQFTLRALGAATGSSDRMLLHYFSDKQALLEATLTCVADRLLNNLRQVQTAKLNQGQLLAALSKLIADPAVLPYTHLWLELTAVAIREGEPYRAVAAQITGMFLAWIKASLNVKSSTDLDDAAAHVLALIEGIILLNAVGRPDEARRALKRAIDP
jgi:AcrR family transcriptional regulator